MKSTPAPEETRANAGPVDLLWTGGWDSTFMLLQALLVDGRAVAPHYLLDPARPSLQVELVTMRRLRERILAEHPGTRELLGPTRYHAALDVEPDPEIAAAHAAVLKKRHIGSQWTWLPGFCRQHGLTDVWLGVTGGDANHFVLRSMMTREPRDGDARQWVYRIDPRFASTDEYALFRYFAYPLWDLSKAEIAAVADDQGWREIMEATWFCHTPRRGTRPCGKCAACRGTILSGMGRRIPASSRALSRVEITVTDPLIATAKRTARRAREKLTGAR